MENKAKILEHLYKALISTRKYQDLEDLDYIAENDTVVAHFMGGGRREINVAMDSGAAMIRDVVNHLG